MKSEIMTLSEAVQKTPFPMMVVIPVTYLLRTYPMIVGLPKSELLNWGVVHYTNAYLLDEAISTDLISIHISDRLEVFSLEIDRLARELQGAYLKGNYDSIGKGLLDHQLDGHVISRDLIYGRVTDLNELPEYILPLGPPKKSVGTITEYLFFTVKALVQSTVEVSALVRYNGKVYCVRLGIDIPTEFGVASPTAILSGVRKWLVENTVKETNVIQMFK